MARAQAPARSRLESKTNFCKQRVPHGSQGPCGASLDRDSPEKWTNLPDYWIPGHHRSGLTSHPGRMGTRAQTFPQETPSAASAASHNAVDPRPQSSTIWQICPLFSSVGAKPMPAWADGRDEPYINENRAPESPVSHLVARTRFELVISALRGRRPEPLDERAICSDSTLAGMEGVEPPLTEPESAVLPLDDIPMGACPSHSRLRVRAGKNNTGAAAIAQAPISKFFRKCRTYGSSR